MGCSSSSAQTVDQEKRPGTKSEASSRDTAETAVKNGTIAEEAKTIEDQMQLPLQTTLKDDPKLVPEEKAEDVLVAMEAQEDLGSGEDLLAVPQPHPEPAAYQELSLESAALFSVGGSAEPEAAVVEEEVEPPVEEAAPVETDLSEVPAVVEVLVDVNDETPADGSVEEVQTEVSDAAKEAVPEPAVGAEPTWTPVTEEEPQIEPVEGPAKAAPGAPSNEAPPVTAEEQTKNSAPEPVSETSTEDSGNAPNESSASDEALAPHDAPDPSVASAPSEAAAPAEPSVPAEAVSPVIDTAIAAATIPEISSLSAAAALNEPQPHPEEATEDLTATPTEAPCPPEATYVPPTEAESAAELVQNLELPAPASSLPETPLQAAEDKAPPVDVTSKLAAEVSVVESISDQSEDSTAPEPEVASANEVPQESEAAKKED